MRLVAMLLSALLVVSGCAANSYKIPHGELQRIAAMAPEQRAQRVLVSQELSATDVQSAQPVSAESEVIWIPDVQVGGNGYYGGGGGRNGSWGGWSSAGGSGGGGKVSTGGGGTGGGGKGLSLGSGGGDAKGAAVALLVLAAVALVAVGVVEGSRYDGWVQLHPMHPVHLIGKDGTQTTIPLAWVDQQAVAWADKAIVRPTEGPWRELERKPLTRTGNYGMYAGYSTSRSVTGDADFGPAFAIQGGYFPDQRVGILAHIGFNWRNNEFGGTLFDSRYMLELQAMPLAMGKLHVGGYVGAGLGYRWEDVPGATLMSGDTGTTVLQGGGQLQLDLHTRIAFTARLGVVKAHDDRQTDMLFGLSIY